ncbi:hypothetical protein Q7P35_010470 [Cladosporium inversicolor]
MDIPLCVSQCLEKFRINNGKVDSHISDEYGRFKVWVGNVSAHRPSHSRRSLEYRLRDSSNLRTTVVSLLQDLKSALDDFGAVVSCGTYPNQDGVERPPLQELEGPVDKLDDEAFVISDDEDRPEANPEQLAIEEVHEIINCLLRFSMALRRPARNNQRKKNFIGVSEYSVPFDIDHVRAKFPTSPQYLTERLGRNISLHRDYFQYRETHRERLSEGLEDAETEASHQQSTIATSLYEAAVPALEDSLVETSTDTESIYSQTSYAASETDNGVPRIPAWPLNARDGEPFECPICYGIIVADTELSWKQHVFEDLPPYVCTREVCAVSTTALSRRRDWAHHEANMHDKSWLCPYGCGGAISSIKRLGSHMRSMHDQTLSHEVLHEMADACVLAGTDTRSTECPLCGKLCKSYKAWIKHVGHHLEQLALFALPLRMLAVDSGDEKSDDTSDSEQPMYSLNVVSGEVNKDTSRTVEAQAGPAEIQPEAAKQVTFEDLVSVQMMEVTKQMQQEVKKQLERIERAPKSGKKSDGLEEQTRNSDELAQDLLAQARANLRKGEDDVQDLRRGFMALSPTQREEALRDLSYGNDLFSKMPGEDGHITVFNEAPSAVRAVPSDQESRDLNMEQLKVAMQKLSQCQQAMSNVINTMHENAMNPIRNIKP